MCILSEWKTHYSRLLCPRVAQGNWKKKEGFSTLQLHVQKNRLLSAMRSIVINGAISKDAARAAFSKRLIRNFCFIPRPVVNRLQTITRLSSNQRRSVKNLIYM